MRETFEALHQEIAIIDSGTLSDEEVGERCSQVYETIGQIANTPAQSLNDVLVKLKELEYVIRDWRLDTQWHEPLLRTAREGVERLLRTA